MLNYQFFKYLITLKPAKLTTICINIITGKRLLKAYLFAKLLNSCQWYSAKCYNISSSLTLEKGKIKYRLIK